MSDELKEKIVQTIMAACPSSISPPSRWEAEHYADAVLSIPEVAEAFDLRSNPHAWFKYGNSWMRADTPASLD